MSTNTKEIPIIKSEPRTFTEFNLCDVVHLKKQNVGVEDVDWIRNVL